MPRGLAALLEVIRDIHCGGLHLDRPVDACIEMSYQALGCKSAALRSGSLDNYFFNSSPIVRAMRLTDPAWRPSSAAIFDAPIPCRASPTNRRTSCSAHCFGFGVFMVRAALKTCRPLNRFA